MLSLHTVQFELEAFNKACRVKARDKNWSGAAIDQAINGR